MTIGLTPELDAIRKRHLLDSSKKHGELNAIELNADRAKLLAIIDRLLPGATSPDGGRDAWQRIETGYPNDGERVDVWIDLTGLHVNDRSYARIACWGPTGFTDGHGGNSIANITHWKRIIPPKGDSA